MRQFTVLFGGTTFATTAVLSAFFLGTAIGNAVLGRRVSVWAHPLRVFGLLEIGVGLSALLVRPGLHLYRAVYPALYAAFVDSPAVFTLLKLALAMVAIGLPTFFMGGTLPALAEAVRSERAGLGRTAGGLYAVNVIGAAVGALAVPFLLLPRLGVLAATALAAGGSIVVGLTACRLSLRRSPRTASAAPSPRQNPRASTVPTRVLVFAFWSGLCTLGLEVLWTRMFSLVHESSLYPFAIVVVVFLLGLAIGAAVARLGLARGVSGESLLARGWSAAGILVLLSPCLFYRLTGDLAYLSASGSLPALGRLSLLAMVVMFPATIGLGMALPSLMEMAGSGNVAAGPNLGRLLSVNTIGAILGPIVVTFVAAPALGLWTSVVLLGILTALAALPFQPRARERWAIGLAAIAILVFLRPTGLLPARVRADAGERLVSVREGSYGTTAVVEDGHDRWITVNNSYVLGGAASASEERWQGHLPLFLHPHPEHVAFIGMGTAITAGAARIHPTGSIVALEIVPEVVAAARADFASVNAGILADPRTHVVIDDGRNYLSSAGASFDVIVGDLLVPWRPAEAPLYSREYLKAVRGALRPDGLFCEWLPLYQLSEEQLRILFRTFLDVFPHATVWRGNFLSQEPTLALVGHLGADPLDAAAVDRRSAAEAPSLLPLDIPFLRHPSGPWLFLVGALRPGASWLGAGPRNEDDQPWVELAAQPGSRHFGGERLEALLDDVAAEPLADTPLAKLDRSHLALRAQGRALAHAALRPGPDGEQDVLTILRTLPAALQGALGVTQASE